MCRYATHFPYELVLERSSPKVEHRIGFRFFQVIICVGVLVASPVFRFLGLHLPNNILDDSTVNTIPLFLSVL